MDLGAQSNRGRGAFDNSNVFGGPSDLIVDEDLVKRYGGHGSQYVSCPMLDRIVEAFNADAARHLISTRAIGRLSQL